MISAVEALKLPSASLNEEQRKQADAVEQSIEEHVRKCMEWRGIDIQTKLTDPNVLAEVNRRLRAAGYITEWRPLVETNRFNAAAKQLTGWALNLSPGDDAYKEATKIALV